MRITNNLLIHNMLWNMNNNLVSMNDKQTQLATGKKIHKPSDDPVGTTRVIKVKSDIVENAQYKENVRDAQSWLDVSENSLMDIKNLLQRTRELAVQASNDTYTSVETDKIAKEINQLLEEVIVNANSTIAGRYLFSGFNTDTKLLKDDGTYNIDITSEKMTEFQSIAYEVAVGEYMDVGTNYLDVFGFVEEASTLIDTFVFGDVASGEARYGESTGGAATHSKIRTPVDYTKDLTGTPTTITVDGTVFTVDESKLTGKLSQEEFSEVIKSATQTSPAGNKVLADVADIYFVKSLNPESKQSDLIIEANAFGAKAMSISSGANAFATNPIVEGGLASVPPKNASFVGTFDKSVDLTGETLSFTFGSKVYMVDPTTLDGAPTTDANVLAAVQNAVTSDGDVLSDAVNVSFVDIGSNQGTLTLTSKVAKTEVVDHASSGAAFVAAPVETDGVTAEAATASNHVGTIDYSTDLSGSTLTFSYPTAATTYTVVTTTMDGSLTKTEVLDLIKGADDGSGNKLGDVANITFIGHGESDSTIGSLKLEAKTPGAGDFVMTAGGPNDMYLAYPQTEVGSGLIEPVKALIDGTFDYSANLSAATLSFELAGTTYTVDTTSMTGPGAVTEEDFLTLIKNASDGGSGKLSDWMNISFVPTAGSQGVLTIEQKTGKTAIVNVSDTGSGFTAAPTEVDGVDGVINTKAIVTGKTEITDAMLADPIKGVGIQSFVVTYNDKTARIDVDLTAVNTTAEMKSAIDAKLLSSFGDDGGAPPKNNVSFDVIYDGAKDVVQFTGAPKDDGSRTFLKVDTIMSNKPKLIEDLENFTAALAVKDDEKIGNFITHVDSHLDNVITTIADIGAKTNRLDFIENRIADNNIVMTEILSKVQDIDYAEVTIQFKSLESIYRASLSVGAKVIQPTLVDFIQ